MSTSAHQRINGRALGIREAPLRWLDPTDRPDPVDHGGGVYGGSPDWYANVGVRATIDPKGNLTPDRSSYTGWGAELGYIS